MIICIEDPYTGLKAPIVLVMLRHNTCYLYCTSAVTELCSNPKAIQNARREPVVEGADGFYPSLVEFCLMKLYLEDSFSFARLTNGFNQSVFPPHYSSTSESPLVE